jgi:hypothetical protein
MITITGTTFARSLSTMALSGVFVAIVTRSGSTLGTGASDSFGKFSIAIATAGIPVDAFVKASAGGYLETDFYPAVPWAADRGENDIYLVTPQTGTALAGQVNQVLNSDAGQIFVRLVDCQGKALSGATTSSTPSVSQTFYVKNGAPTTTAAATDLSGSAFLLNVPPGATTLGGQTGSTTLRHRTISSVPNAVVQVELQP